MADILTLSAVAVVFLYQITVFYNKTQQHHFLNYFNDSMQTVYARGGGCGSQQREVADVVFTDTDIPLYNFVLCNLAVYFILLLTK